MALGIVVVVVGATALMAVAAFGLAGTTDAGSFTDAGAVAAGLASHSGRTVGTLFAIILLDASLIGANAIGLATTYAVGDALGKRHSLHWKITEAPWFYGGYALLLAVSAAVAFSPDHVLGLITQGVQALAGVVLPSATVFLVLLCNDRELLGPWSNSLRQNIVAWTIVWSLVLLSLALTAATLFPRLSTQTIGIGLAAGVLIGIVGGAVAILASRREPAVRLSREPAVRLTRPERRTVRQQQLTDWRTPCLATLQRPTMSPTRTAGLCTLRAYLVVAVILVVVKIIQTV